MNTVYIIEEMIETISKVELFSNLHLDEIETIARNSQVVRYPAGSLIFAEHDPSNELYMVKEGEVLITKHLEDENDMYLAQYIAGESFGEMDLINNTPRDATAVSLRDTELLIFPRKGTSFTSIMNRHPQVSSHILHQLITIIAGRIRSTHKLIREKTPWLHSLKRQALVDKLTGLYNRDFLEEYLRMLRDESGSSTSILMIKPDNFKQLNDTYGHEAGDKVLILMAIFIQSILRESDAAVRFHGDEFALVLPGTEKKEAIIIAKEAGKAIYDIDLSMVTSGNDFRITVSIGLATCPEHKERDIVNIAFEKMMDARNRGGNRIVSVR